MQHRDNLPYRAEESEVVDDANPVACEPLAVDSDPRLRPLCISYLTELSDGIRHKFGPGPPDPDDVAQEAFSRLLALPDTLSIRNLKGYLWRTARNLVLDATKASQIRSRYDFEVEEIYFPLRGDNMSPENVLLAQEQLTVINAALRRMPQKRRRAIVLYRIEGLTMEEVARRLGVSRTAAHKHVAKAHAEINALFAEEVRA